MPYLRLLPHVSFGLVGERAVFLDLSRDRYLSLDGESAAAFRRLCESDEPLSVAAADRLVATRLFERTQMPGPVEPVKAPPAESQAELTAAAGPAGIWDVPGVWRLLRRAARDLRARPLHLVLAGRLAADRRASAKDPDRAAALAVRFRRARAAVPVSPRCLPDSLALWDWLRARGAPASIVFGVKLDPFGAHCWVQQDTLALNEAVDRTGDYTPVFMFP